MKNTECCQKDLVRTLFYIWLVASVDHRDEKWYGHPGHCVNTLINIIKYIWSYQKIFMSLDSQKIGSKIGFSKKKMFHSRPRQILHPIIT